MKSLSGMAACAAFVSAILAAPSHAAVITVNQTLDLTAAKSATAAGFQGWSGTPAFSGGINVDIAEGDTLDLTIDFLGDQTLTVTGLKWVWALLNAGQGNDVSGSSSFSFLNAAGQSFLGDQKVSRYGSLNIGDSFFTSFGAFNGALPSPITFSGIHYVGTVDDYIASSGQVSITSRNYSSASFYFGTAVGGSAVVGTAPVPEPETYAMMMAGLGLLALARRRLGTVI